MLSASMEFSLRDSINCWIIQKIELDEKAGVANKRVMDLESFLQCTLYECRGTFDKFIDKE
jgi:hypothetical protein